MEVKLLYQAWDEMDKVEKDVIEAIDRITTFSEDLDEGKIEITIKYIGKTWDECSTNLKKGYIK
jgi:hypothetical protein